MRPVVRLNDQCSGHNCFPPRPNNKASEDVFINNKGSHRQTDTWNSHCCGDECHGGYSVKGAPTVYVNGLQMFRQGDPVSCGSVGMQGSPDTFCGP